MSKRKPKPAKKSQHVLEDVPTAKPPLVFKAWANRWQGKVGHSVYWTRDEARLAAGPGSKPVRVRVEVTEI